jgi:hypothetical protein
MCSAIKLPPPPILIIDFVLDALHEQVHSIQFIYDQGIGFQLFEQHENGLDVLGTEIRQWGDLDVPEQLLEIGHGVFVGPRGLFGEGTGGIGVDERG